MSHSSSVVPSIEGREGEELKRRECVEKIKSSLSADPALARRFARRNRLLRNGEIFKARFGDYKPCSCGINTSKAASFSLLEKIRKDLESSAPEVLDSHSIIEVTPLCEMAIKEASVERGTQFELRRIIEVRAMGCFIKTYYITFEAENPSKKNLVTFQAVGQAGEVRGGKEILDWKIEESGGTGCKESSCAQPLDVGAELRTLRIEGCGEQIARKKMKQVKGKPRQIDRNVRASGHLVIR